MRPVNPSDVSRLYGGARRRLTKLANGIQDRVTFSRQLERATPVLVYQMGKVGSTSLRRSLAIAYRGIAANTHDFSADHRQWLVRRLHQAIKEEGAPLDIISLVREPVGRNVSAFFENYERFTGVAYRDSDFDVAQLRTLFLANHTHELPLVWFEKHIEPSFGIDVYQWPFPERGYATYANDRFRLLVMRVETPDAAKEEAISDFLALKDFRLVRANVGDAKEYAAQYRAFKQEVRLPNSYLETMCKSRFFTHFYSPETISSIRERWIDEQEEKVAPPR